MHYTINYIIGPRYGGEQCTAELYEDNGGGLHLFLLDEGRSVLYGEYDRDGHDMAQTWVAIMQGSDPFEEVRLGFSCASCWMDIMAEVQRLLWNV